MKKTVQTVAFLPITRHQENITLLRLFDRPLNTHHLVVFSTSLGQQIEQKLILRR